MWVFFLHFCLFHTLYFSKTQLVRFLFKSSFFFGFHKHLIFSLIHKFSFHYWQAIGLRKLVVDQRLSSVFYKFVHFFFFWSWFFTNHDLILGRRILGLFLSSSVLFLSFFYSYLHLAVFLWYENNTGCSCIFCILLYSSVFSGCAEYIHHILVLFCICLCQGKKYVFSFLIPSRRTPHSTQ